MKEPVVLYAISCLMVLNKVENHGYISVSGFFIRGFEP
jgi:hypothetical protein